MSNQLINSLIKNEDVSNDSIFQAMKFMDESEIDYCNMFYRLLENERYLVAKSISAFASRDLSFDMLKVKCLDNNKSFLRCCMIHRIFPLELILEMIADYLPEDDIQLFFYVRGRFDEVDFEKIISILIKKEKYATLAKLFGEVPSIRLTHKHLLSASKKNPETCSIIMNKYEETINNEIKTVDDNDFKKFKELEPTFSLKLLKHVMSKEDTNLEMLEYLLKKADYVDPMIITGSKNKDVVNLVKKYI